MNLSLPPPRGSCQSLQKGDGIAWTGRRRNYLKDGDLSLMENFLSGEI
jgi:hypothetical protein